MTALIEAEGLCYGVKGKEILKEVSFHVDQGAFLSIIGPNGAGKTTLLKCLIRINKPTRGSVRIAGASASALTQRAMARRIAYVPQANGLKPPFTVREFAFMARYPYSSPFAAATARDEAAVDKALALTGMDAFADRPMGHLSGGERQKALIAAALAQEAPILLLDEATTFLDPAHQEEILRILRTINREQGATILSVTHDLNGAALSGDRVMALKEGRVLCLVDAGAIMDNAILERIYDKTFLFVDHPATGRRLVVPGEVG